jgi:hypothetical protein
MRLRTLNIVLCVGGAFLGGMLVVLGLILQNQADFAKSYVHDQLSDQQITFATIDELGPSERDDPNASCLEDFASQPLTTGEQAECYANYFIAIHLSEINDGRTYAETALDQVDASAAALKAKTSGAADASDLEVKADQLATETQALFRGGTLRGLLLTNYGFSVLGARAAQAAVIVFAVALILFIASIVGVVHVFLTSRDTRMFFPGRRSTDPPGTIVMRRPKADR